MVFSRVVYPLFSWIKPINFGLALVNLFSLCIAAWVGSDLFWSLQNHPKPLIPNPIITDPVKASEAITSRFPFGKRTTEKFIGTPSVDSSFTLQAAITKSAKQPGWAVLSDSAGAQFFLVEGQVAVNGIALEKVFPDRVEVSRNGGSLTIPLAERKVLSTQSNQMVQSKTVYGPPNSQPLVNTQPLQSPSQLFPTGLPTQP
ncbi:type II secretion system protein N [Methylophilus sp. 3sh_L]|uniref:type II secretion system protein N n=1 Tax=Methylophilus sp. 3sh_L TaxID=3377114 RepID=UPI00398E381F